MNKRKAPRRTTPRPTRSGTPWLRASSADCALGPVEQEMFVVLLKLRRSLGREPTPDEVGERLGLRASEVRPRLAKLKEIGLPARLTKQQEHCITAIADLEARLGRSPSTREVSAEMGLSSTGARFHILHLVRMGLVTPPEMVLVLSVTPAGRALLPQA